MIDLERIASGTLETDPFSFAEISGLFAPRDAEELARTYPRDAFKTVEGYDGEKGYVYDVRSLVHMGASAPTAPGSLSPAWRRLAEGLLSPAYRDALGRLVSLDLASAPLEVNVFHFGTGAWMGPHVDLAAKRVTHVLYFNEAWSEEDGGCLSILRSSNEADVARRVPPVVGRSAVLVRSESSWHAVSRVRDGCRFSRRSVTVTFYEPGSVSTMWPPGDATPLHRYRGDATRTGLFARLLRRA